MCLFVPDVVLVGRGFVVRSLFGRRTWLISAAMSLNLVVGVRFRQLRAHNLCRSCLFTGSCTTRTTATCFALATQVLCVD